MCVYIYIACVSIRYMSNISLRIFIFMILFLGISEEAEIACEIIYYEYDFFLLLMPRLKRVKGFALSERFFFLI